MMLRLVAENAPRRAPTAGHPLTIITMSTLKSIIVIKASAGSGKTYQLTKEYIRLLLGEQDKATGEFRLKPRREYHQHIMAVTFTNKATEEMKRRITDELEKLALGDSGYEKDLMAELHTGAEPLRQAAQTALEELLFGYSSFNVSTIDAFFQNVLRTFAFELSFNDDYMVETNDTMVTAAAASAVLSSVGTGESNNRVVEQWFADFARNCLDGYFDSQSGWDIFNKGTIMEFAKVINGEAFQQHKKEITEYLRDVTQPGATARITRFRNALWQMVLKHEQQLKNLADEYLAALESIGLTIEKMSSQSGLAKLHDQLGLKKMAKRPSVKVVRELIDKISTADVSTAVSKLCTDKAWKKTAKTGCYDHVWPTIVSIAERCLPLRIENAALKSAYREVFKFGMLGFILNEQEEFLRVNNLVLLANTNQLLKRVIHDGEVPFMYERVGTWINHFLIDEFQDTSAMQYDNMRPLLTESVAEGNENLIIGDEKQCIYRFRNSDPMLLQSTVADDYASSVHVDETKTVNWRSTPTVVRFNNTFFASILDFLHAGETYRNLVQVPRPKPHCNPGAVVVRVLPKNLPADKYGPLAQDMVWYTAKERGGKEHKEDSQSVETQKYVLYRLPEYINEIRSRGYRCKDIAILVSKNTEGASVITRLLAYNKTVDEPLRIPVVSAESMYLRNSPAVRLVVSTMRQLDQMMPIESKHEQARLERMRSRHMHQVLRHYHNRQSVSGLVAADSDTQEAALAAGEILKQCFVQFPRPESATAQAAALGEEDTLRRQVLYGCADTLDVMSLLENIVATALTPEVREKESAYVYAFMDYVADYCSRYNATLHSVLKWWDACGETLSVNSSDDSDSVKVMTIHKSKGLEFACVIIPFADWQMCRLGQSLWVERDTFCQATPFAGLDRDEVPPLVPLPPDVAKHTEGLQDFYETNAAESIIDNLNRTYVAFTRAINEMHIFAISDGGEHDYDSCSIGDLLACGMPKLDGANAAALDEAHAAATKGKKVAIQVDDITGGDPIASEDEEMTVYAVGDPSQGFTPEEEKKTDANASAVNALGELDTLPVSISKDVPVYSAVASELHVTMPEVWSDTQEKGIRLHSVMEMVHDATCVDYALRCSRYRHAVSDEDAPAVEAMLRHLVSDERTAPWFAPGCEVMCERTIFHCGRRVLNGRVVPARDRRAKQRPDRVVRTADGRVVVIDYKFGSDTDAPINRYTDQVRTYMLCLEEAGLKPDAGYVVFPFTMRVVEVRIG